MSFDAALLVNAQPAPSIALASDPAASILKHAVKIWAREHGIAEDDLSRLTDMVLAFASSAILDSRRGVPIDA
jgi:hypothetical protein